MKKLRIFQVNPLILLIMVLTSCASFKAQAPENFAEYTDTPSTKFKAVSADGILYRVSEYKQESEASLDFWRGAFLLKMKNANYKQEDSLNVSLGGKPAIGYIFSFANNTGSDSYLVAAVQSKGKMFVVEAAGESVKFETRKKDILDAINKININ